jgi:deoxyribose-phosphate aldolase
MTDKAKKALHDKLVSGLQSSDAKVVTESINQLREEGQLEDIVILFDLLMKSKDDDLKDTILKFLADVKEKKADKIFIDAILNKKYKTIRKDLTGICWQSSIDFTKHVEVFTGLLVNSDFETAFEAFTVIENFTGKIDADKKAEEQNKLKDAIPNASEEIKGMIHECIHILDQF